MKHYLYDQMKNKFFFYLTVLFSSLVLISCEDDTVTPQNNNDRELTDAELFNEEVNNWIFDVMDEVYFWTDKKNAVNDPYQNPISYFDSLLFADDRFSAIVPNYQELLNSLNGVELEAGYDFSLLDGGNNRVVAIITYIKPNSPAAETDLKRGDVITEINGQEMTFDNYQSLIGATSSNHSVGYLRYNEATDAYEAQSTIELSVVSVTENPVFLDSVYSVEGRKIGYLVYNFFSNGSSGDNFDTQLENVIADFKSEGVTDFVLDLRYNGGGSVLSATKLASNLAPGASSTKVFYRNQWNDLYQSFWENEPDGDRQLTGYFTDPTSNIASQINENIYILTGRGTASASELMINGLDPYMNVTLIGNTTVGKNVVSVPIEDTENPENEYGLLPIVLKIANVDGFSGFDNGFTPQGENLINEFAFPLEPLGDVNDPLLNRAIELITGTSVEGRKAAIKQFENVTYLGSSADRFLKTNTAVLPTELIKR